MMVDEAVVKDLTVKLDGQSEQSRRLQGDLEHALGELRSFQNDLLVANKQIKNITATQQYRDEKHRSSLETLGSKINVACVEGDARKLQLSASRLRP